jgi:hypothetical protein
MEEILTKWETPMQKKEAYDHLNNLIQMPGWKIITDIIEENVGELTESVLDPAEGMSEADINRLRDKIKLQRNFCRLPGMLMDGLTSGPVQKDVEFDAFE